MNIQTRITERLAIRHPLLGAPMAGVAGIDLARAVSAGGGLGFVGGGYGEGDWLKQELSGVDCSTVGVGFITWRLQQRPELLDIALDHGPKAIFLSFGDVARFGPRIRASGSVFIAQVQSLRHARAAADAGADIVVAQGTEAGGHGAVRATLPLVPAVVDALAPIPVVAAGGIADGRGLAAALMLGAAGALLGTRFYCARESMVPAAAKARAVAASGDDTVRSSVYDILRGYDWPQPYKLRTLTNAMTRDYADQITTLEQHRAAQQARFEAAVATKDYDVAPVIAGEALDLVHDVPGAADIVADIVREATACLARPAHFTLSD